jgi:hypothetical protein
VGIDSFRAALEAIYPGKTSEVEVIDFFGRDVAFSHLCAACADLLSARVPGSSRIVADLAQLFATYLAEKDFDRFPARIRQVQHDPESSYLVDGRRSSRGPIGPTS